MTRIERDIIDFLEYRAKKRGNIPTNRTIAAELSLDFGAVVYQTDKLKKAGFYDELKTRFKMKDTKPKPEDNSKLRKCLGVNAKGGLCNKMFKSEHSGQRICPSCKGGSIYLGQGADNYHFAYGD